MKARLKEKVGGTKSKLACVKRVKELTGLGLKEAKELVDGTRYEEVHFDIGYNRADIESMKEDFDNWGYILKGGREEALDGLLGDIYKYIIEYTGRDVTYKIEEGEYYIRDNFYFFKVKLGIKLDDSGEKNINDRVIKIPVDSVILEENNG